MWDGGEEKQPIDFALSVRNENLEASYAAIFSRREECCVDEQRLLFRLGKLFDGICLHDDSLDTNVFWSYRYY